MIRFLTVILILLVLPTSVSALSNLTSIQEEQAKITQRISDLADKEIDCKLQKLLSQQAALNRVARSFKEDYLRRGFRVKQYFTSLKSRLGITLLPDAIREFEGYVIFRHNIVMYETEKKYGRC